MRRLLRILALAVVPVAAWPATAPAAVDIGSERVTVSGRDARAVVERRPVRMTFTDAAGRPVLEQVAGGASPEGLVAADPVPTGLADARDPGLYAPLTFTVGAQRNVEYPGLFYGGNRLLGMRGGVQYSAREVLDARPLGEGAELELSTNDPSGRRLRVVVEPEPSGGVRVRAQPTPADGVIAVGDAFASGDDEAFHGFGGRHNALSQRGNDFYNWIEQENQGAADLQGVPDATGPAGSGGDRYLFPNGPTAAYHVHSLFVSSRPYGFLLDRPELSRWRMASDRADAWSVSVAAAQLDYVVAPGSGPRAIEALTAITGRQRVAPDWALGPMYDRGYNPTGDAEADVRADLEQFRRHDLPVTGYRVESWEVIPRERLRDLFADMRAQGIKPLVYVNPYIDPQDAQYATKTPAGTPYLFPTGNIPAFGGLLDVTDPAAVRWWQGRITEAFELGAEGMMQDFGEAAQAQMRFANGEDGTTMHNRYPVEYHRITREAADRFERAHPGRRIAFYTRAGYSGRPGSSAYDSANFPGDETTDWSRSSGIASLATDMLNRGIGGAVGYTTDIGGYLDTTTPATTKELLVRWAEWAALSPLFRLHGSVSQGPHFPWRYDDETVALYRRLSHLHLRALPLIRELWGKSVRTGMPIARPLWLQAPGDAEAARQDQEWMLGDDVLVAPVVTEGATSRDVYFPAGCWTHGDTAERFRGPGAARVEAPLGRLPWFIRCGTRPFDVGGGAASLPSARRCRSRRAFVIRLRRPRGGEGLRSARVIVNGRRVRVIRGRRLRARIVLRGLRRGTYTVRVDAVTRSGRRLVSTRTYRTCRSRAESRKGSRPRRPRPRRG